MEEPSPSASTDIYFPYYTVCVLSPCKKLLLKLDCSYKYDRANVNIS